MDRRKDLNILIIKEGLLTLTANTLTRDKKGQKKRQKRDKK